jgi:hypothetical protein
VERMLHQPGKGQLPESAVELLSGNHLLIAGIDPADFISQFIPQTRPTTIDVRPGPTPVATRPAQPRQPKQPSPPPGGGAFLPGPPYLLPLHAVAARAVDEPPGDPFADMPLEDRLVFKPLLQARFIVLAVDAGKSLKLESHVYFRNPEDAQDGEPILRMLLYLAREFPAAALRRDGTLDVKQTPQLNQVLQTFAKALRQTTVERRDAVFQIHVEVPLDAALLAGAMEEMTRFTARTQGANNMKQSANNLRQIALAMHSFRDAYDSLPGAAICNADGKPLLSWRVAILPFIGANDLYRSFKLDEPWDSENNKKLLARMPEIYSVPGDPATARHETYYRVFTGKDAVFPLKNSQNGPMSLGRKLTEITDGFSNTLLAVEAAQSVPWTKPDELVYDADKPLPKLGKPFTGGFHAAFMDAHVAFVPESVSQKTLRALITPQGGETIDYRELNGSK